MENSYTLLIQNIVNSFLSHEKTAEPWRVSRNTPIRIHNEKLSHLGEASFSIKWDLWSKYFDITKGAQLNEDAFQLLSDKEKQQRFLAATQGWDMPVARLVIEQERCHLHLQRSAVVQRLIYNVLSDNNYGALKKTDALKIHINPLRSCDEYAEDLCHYRSMLMHRTLRKLLAYSKHKVIETESFMNRNDPNVLDIEVLSFAAKLAYENNMTRGVTLKCGLVTDPQNKGKKCLLSAEEYLKLRTNDMYLMALHKYGIRLKQDNSFWTQMEKLGSAAVTVDLLEVRHTSPVQIIRKGQGSTKGASFILYNSARLEALLRTFNERIDKSAYEALPEINNIDWSIIIEEEEWQLVFAYLGGFPDLIERCLEQLDRGICGTHMIVRFLHGLAATFSVYYRRIRILTDKRDHLMPYVYARIYLVRAVREVLNKALGLLGIQPVEFM